MNAVARYIVSVKHHKVEYVGLDSSGRFLGPRWSDFDALFFVLLAERC